MKYANIVAMILLVIVSLSAGFAKAAKMPQEVAFFEQTGLNVNLVIVFGIAQMAGAFLTMIPKSRKLGLMIMAIMFLLSAVQIFMTGNLAFGAVSLIPAALAFFLWRYERPAN